MRMQAATEYLITYGWALLIIAVAIGAIAYFVTVPSSIVTNTCTFSSTLICSDVSFGTNTTSGNTYLTVYIQNNGEYAIQNPIMIVNIAGANSSVGQCNAYLLSPGVTANCQTVLNLSNVKLGQLETGTIYVEGGNCGVLANYISTGICTGAPNMTVVGTFTAHAESFTPIPNVYCIGDLGYIGYPSPATNGIWSARMLPSLPAPFTNAWKLTTTLPTTVVQSPSCGYSDSYIYCVTGKGLGTTSNVYSTSITALGSVSQWLTTNSYPIGLENFACSQYNGYMYCAGGYTGSSAVSNVFAANASAGVVSTWNPGSSYPISVSQLSCAAYGGYDYCVGGLAGSGTVNSVYSAPVSGNSVGTWTQQASYPVSGISQESCVANDGFIYCVGGANPSQTAQSNSVYSAPIGNGHLGPWTQTTSYPISVSFPACASSNGYLYCFGGYNSGVGIYGVTNTIVGQLSQGSVLQWENSVPFLGYIYKASCISPS